MKKELEYYKPSKSSSPWFYPMALMMMVVAAPLLSIVYAEVQNFILLEILNIVISVVFLVLLFIILMSTLRIARVANDNISKWYSWTFVLLVYYLHWSANLYLSVHEVSFEHGISSNHHYFSLAMQPSTMWTYFTLDAPFWTWILWIIELIGILLVAFISSAGFFLEPYSDKNKAWFVKSSISVDYFISNEMLDAIANNDYDFFLNLHLHTVKRKDYNIVDLYTSQSEPNYLWLTTMTAKTEDDGSPSFSEKTTIRNIKINNNIKDILLDINKLAIKKQESNNNNIEQHNEVPIALNNSIQENNNNNTDKIEQYNEALIENKEIVNTEDSLEHTNDLSTKSKEPSSHSINDNNPQLEISFDRRSTEKKAQIIIGVIAALFVIILLITSIAVFGIKIFFIVLAIGALPLGLAFLFTKLMQTGKKDVIKINDDRLFIDSSINNKEEDINILLKNMVDIRLYQPTGLGRQSPPPIVIIHHNTPKKEVRIDINIDKIKVKKNEFVELLSSLVGKNIEQRKQILQFGSIDNDENDLIGDEWKRDY